MEYDAFARLKRDRRKKTDNLELHGLALKLNRPNLEVDTDGTNVALRVRIIGEPQEETRLCTRSAGLVRQQCDCACNKECYRPCRRRNHR